MAAMVLGQAGEGSGRSCPLCLSSDHTKDDCALQPFEQPKHVPLPSTHFLLMVVLLAVQSRTRPWTLTSAAGSTVAIAPVCPAVLNTYAWADPSRGMLKCTARMGGSSPECPEQGRGNPGLRLWPRSQPHPQRKRERGNQKPPCTHSPNWLCITHVCLGSCMYDLAALLFSVLPVLFQCHFCRNLLLC